LESLILLQTLEPEFYHFKEQIKVMKQSEIDSKKMRSLINNYLIQTTKPAASANLANKNKQKAEEG